MEGQGRPRRAGGRSDQDLWQRDVSCPNHFFFIPTRQSLTISSYSIRVAFTIADINNISEDAGDEFADEALSDEGDLQGQSQEGRNAEGEDEILPPTFPARVNVTVEKPKNGALLIQAIIQDGDLQIEEISHFKDAEIANAHTAEKDWARQSLYAGPPAENLDPDLIAFWGRYLEERGLNVEFQNMVTDYISFKEQKEYVRWLESKFSLQPANAV